MLVKGVVFSACETKLDSAESVPVRQGGFSVHARRSGNQCLGEYCLRQGRDFTSPPAGRSGVECDMIVYTKKTRPVLYVLQAMVW